MTTSPAPDRAPRSPWLLAFALGGGPVAWLVHLSLSYYLVPRACAAGTSLGLHLVTLASAAVAVAAVVASRRVRAGDDPRGRFLGTLGVLVGVLFLAAVLVEGLPVALIDACR